MKKKNLDKLLAALLISAMAVGMVGCGSEEQTEKPAENNEESAVKSEMPAESSTQNVEEDAYFNAEGYPICDEPITIKVSGQNQGTEGWNNTEMVAEIEKQFGIVMDCSELQKEAWETQFTLMIASDEVPDLILNPNRDLPEINKYGLEGYFLPLNEYLDYMPNFKAFLEKYPDYKAFLTCDDGNIYGLTAFNENPVTRLSRSFINRTWLENVNMEYPTNVDELYEVFKAFKEQDANGNGDKDDEIPLSGDLTTLVPFLHAYGIFSDDVTYSPILDSDGKVMFGQATDNFKAFLQYMHKLYEEGLYDVDALIQASSEFDAKCREERVGAYTTGAAPFVHAGQGLEYDINWEYLAWLTSDYNDVNAAVYNSGISGNVKIVVSADTEYPEAVCRLIDYFYSDQGSITASRGFENISCEMVENDIDPTQKEVRMIEDFGDAYSSAEEYRYKKAIINEGFNVRKIYYGTVFQIMESMSDEQLAEGVKEGLIFTWSDSMEIGRRKLTPVDVFPKLTYTSEENDRLSTLKTDITMYVVQACGQFIIGELDIEKEWDNYISTLKSIGMDELISIEQSAYDRAYK